MDMHALVCTFGSIKKSAGRYWACFEFLRICKGRKKGKIKKLLVMLMCSNSLPEEPSSPSTLSPYSSSLRQGTQHASSSAEGGCAGRQAAAWHKSQVQENHTGQGREQDICSSRPKQIKLSVLLDSQMQQPLNTEHENKTAHRVYYELSQHTCYLIMMAMQLRFLSVG